MDLNHYDLVTVCRRSVLVTIRTQVYGCSDAAKARLHRFSRIVVPEIVMLNFFPVDPYPHCRFVRFGNTFPVRCKNVFSIFLLDRDYLISSIDRYYFL